MRGPFLDRRVELVAIAIAGLLAILLVMPGVRPPRRQEQPKPSLLGQASPTSKTRSCADFRDPPRAFRNAAGQAGVYPHKGPHLQGQDEGADQG